MAVITIANNPEFHDLLDLKANIVFSTETGEELGKLKEVIAYPGHDVFVVKGEKEFMVPAVPAFIDSIDLESNEMRIHVWEGLI